MLQKERFEKLFSFQTVNTASNIIFLKVESFQAGTDSWWCTIPGADINGEQ